MLKKKYEKESSRSVSENSANNCNRSKFKKCVIKLCKINASAASSNGKVSEYKDLLRKANGKNSDDNMLLQKKNSIHPMESDSKIKANKIKPTLARLRKINVMKQANHGNNSNISNESLNHGKKQRVLSDPKLNQPIYRTKEIVNSNSNVQLQPGQSIFSKNKVLNKSAMKISANKSNSFGIGNESDDVYDFPSESNVSEQEDPAIDVVKKLIEEGKVSVAKHKRFPTKKKKTKRRAQRAPRNYNKNIKEIEKKMIQNVELGFSEMEFSQQKRSPILRKEGDQLQNPVKLIDSTEGTPKGITKRQVIPRRALITDKMKLLGAAKNFVRQSTPLNKKNISKPNNRLSPIYISSPWRPPDERTLPRVFYFSRNEDDLPSYSSDVIPSSQTGNGKNISKLNHSGRGYTSMDLSNIENVAPGDAINKTDNQNHDAPKALQHRSPLKTITILEIINLPNRAKVAEKHTTQKPQELSCNRLPISDSAGQRNAENNNKTDTDLNNINVINMTIENCFGFDDIGENENLETYKAIPSKNQLQRKLKNLKRLLPPKPTRVSYGKIRTIFAEEPKQKDIREMLTSTRIESRYKNKPKEDFLPEFECSINLSLDEEENNITEGLHLFNDPDEPKITFDSSAHCRTYTRIPKRRRKLQNNLLFFDDDESEEEIEEQEKAPDQKKKRTKPIDKKADEELSHFVEDFNSMCQEVEQYQLQVE